ncbi:MAG: hypothetical protein ACHP84_12420 [Caulobacterales bacterium]
MQIIATAGQAGRVGHAAARPANAFGVHFRSVHMSAEYAESTLYSTAHGWRGRLWNEHASWRRHGARPPEEQGSMDLACLEPLEDAAAGPASALDPTIVADV